MYIKDLQTGEVRKYGTDRHDSLVISEDGRTLSYENLHNGEGSLYGEYRFCDEEGKIPAETKYNYGEEYFNIGGWGEPRFLAHSDGSIEQDTVPFDFELFQAGLMNMPKGMIDVLNEIRADIMAIGNWTTKGELPNGYLVKVIEIIDKYRTESEE